MALDRRELLDDEQEALLMAMDGRLSRLWTAIPGIVVSVNLENNTLTVQPTIQAQVQKPNGSYEYVNLPVLPDVPICFPGAGGFVLTFPISAGDEVLVIFASRCIDSWWQNSGVGKPMESRMHDLSDGFAILAPRSLPNVITNISSENAQLRSEDGETYLEISPSGTMKLKGTTVEVEGDLNVTGKITASDDITTTTDVIAGPTGAITLLTHRHPTTTNPSGVPVP